jgi:hypothetical protein
METDCLSFLPRCRDKLNLLAFYCRRPETQRNGETEKNTGEETEPEFENV